MLISVCMRGVDSRGFHKNTFLATLFYPLPGLADILPAGSHLFSNSLMRPTLYMVEVVDFLLPRIESFDPFADLSDLLSLASVPIGIDKATFLGFHGQIVEEFGIYDRFLLVSGDAP